jgi:hypothetical protein
MTRHATWKSLIAGSQLVFGLALFLTPWIFGFSATATPAWAAWIAGLLIALAGVGALAGHAYPAAWANLVLGIWAILAPWILGFAALAAAMWSHVVLGALVLLAAAVALWMEHGAPTQAHA